MNVLRSYCELVLRRLLITGFLPATLAFAGPRVAILGDSLSTGGAAHPALVFDTEKLYQVFQDQALVQPKLSDIPHAELFHLEDNLAPPRRLWPTTREYLGGPDWVLQHALQSLSQRFLDTEEYAWSYLAARALGANPENILLAAHDGARVTHLARHYDRVLSATRGERPETLFLFYTGNDLCEANLEFLLTPQDYRKEWQAGLSYVLNSGRAPAGGTDVYVLGFLGVLQLRYAPEIQAKKIFAFGETTTCQQLRAQDYRPTSKSVRTPVSQDFWGMLFSQVMPPHYGAMCPTLLGSGRSPTLFGTQDESDKMLGTLANRIRDFREAQKVSVERANQEALKVGGAVRFHYLDATTKLVFAAEDIAADCFHLSLHGHAKIAQAVLAAMAVQK